MESVDMNNYEPVVGMEIHVELKTRSKMFCGCKNDPFHAPNPNIYTCPVCLGLPGALPVPNKKAVEWTVLLGLALGSDIQLFSKFDRKNYFYPDLPKGYQISQYDQPLAIGGSLELSNYPIIQSSNNPIKKKIRIRRVHLEEDTGKLYHQKVDLPADATHQALQAGGKPVSLIDFNRSGVPLVEIVTEPDIRSAEEARVFLKKLQQIVRYLGISDADMEKGSMRLEPNISVRLLSENQIAASRLPPGSRNDKALPNYKVEVKNINSFNFVKKAIEFETARHIEILEQGETPKQETRGWNEDKGITFAQRSKEDAEDYRYFPEPDIPPIRWEKSQIANLKSQIGEMPDAKKERFMKTFGLNDVDADMITESVGRAAFFEESVRSVRSVKGVNEKTVTPKIIANWLINKKIDISKVKPEELVTEIAKATTVEEVADDIIAQAIDTVMAANEKAATDFRAGKEQSFMFLFGQTIKQLAGKGDKKKIQELLRKKLT